MTIKSSTWIVGIAVVASCAIIVGMQVAYKPNKAESVNVSLEPSNPSVNTGSTPVPDRVEEVMEPEISYDPVDKESDEHAVSTSDAIVKPNALDLSEEDSIAKGWFDLKSGKSNEEDLELLVNNMKAALLKGYNPQVVSNFPLDIVDNGVYGFQENILEDTDGELRLVTMVYPNISEQKTTVSLFVVKKSKVGSTVDFYESVGVVPANIGIQSEGSSSYYFIAGDFLDDKIYTEEGSSGIYVIYSDGGKLSLSDLSSSSILIGGVDYSVNGKVLTLKGIPSTGTSVFFYNDIIDEGQSSDELSFVVEDANTSTTYAVSYSERLVFSQTTTSEK